MSAEHLPYPYEPTRTEFVHRMNLLIKRALKPQALRNKLLPVLEGIEADYRTKRALGWTDWENEADLHLRMLRLAIMRLPETKA